MVGNIVPYVAVTLMKIENTMRGRKYCGLYARKLFWLSVWLAGLNESKGDNLRVVRP